MHFQIENFIIFCFSLWNIIASKLHLILLKSIMRKWQKCHHVYIHIEAADDIDSVINTLQELLIAREQGSLLEIKNLGMKSFKEINNRITFFIQ